MSPATPGSISASATEAPVAAVLPLIEKSKTDASLLRTAILPL